MKTKANVGKHIFTICALFFCMFALSPAAVQAAEITSTISVDRAAGKSVYTLKELDPDKTSSFSLIVERKSDSKEVMKKEISLTKENCVNGSSRTCDPCCHPRIRSASCRSNHTCDPCCHPRTRSAPCRRYHRCGFCRCRRASHRHLSHHSRWRTHASDASRRSSTPVSSCGRWRRFAPSFSCRIRYR